MRIRGALALSLTLLSSLSCGAKEGELTASAAASVGASAATVSTWSREAFAPAASGSPDPDATLSPESDPAALAELIARAPKAPRLSTGKDGGTAIGHDAVFSAETVAPVASAAQAAGSPTVIVGAPIVQSTMANPAIERAARAQLYWNLTQRCRDAENHILPPEMIRLQFRIDGDGYILPSTIVATPRDPRFADAARCMQRELATAPFQAPAATRGRDWSVDATVPSVD